MLDLRPFRPEDRAAVLAMMNRNCPPHRCQTVIGWERKDSRRKPELADLRLCVGDPAIAYLRVWDRGTGAVDRKEGVCEFEIEVHHDYRGRGLGNRLYEKAAEFARERGAKRLIANFWEWTPQEPAIAFLQKRGFAEMERETPSFLDLTQWDAAPFQSSLAQAQVYGVRIFTLAEAGDTEENRRRYYALEAPLIGDIPRRDDQPFTMEPYDDWLEFVVKRPDWRPDLVLLAEVSGEWVGESHVVPKLEMPYVGMQWLTGVLAAHRGRGIATALKTRAYECARAAGMTIVTTENHEDNAPMLAINRKFGFQAEPAIVIYNKVLDADA